MTPAKPARLRAIDAACVAQSRTADAISGLAAYESPDLEGALREVQQAQARLQEAGLAIRRAIRERDNNEAERKAV